MPHPLLAVEDVSKTYDGFKAISNLTFYLYEGELRTVIGPNGTGKSTFFDLITRLDTKRGWKAGLLAHGEKQWLEIGMLLAQDPKVLLVDEPAAGMTDEETHRTGELLLSLAGKHSLVVVEHDMTFVKQIARNGQ